MTEPIGYHDFENHEGGVRVEEYMVPMICSKAPESRTQEDDLKVQEDRGSRVTSMDR